MAGTMKYWKEAATLIIAARSKTPISNYIGNKKYTFDYQILMLQRNAKAGFFPSAQVFPGGQIDKADFSPAWLDIFKKYGNVHKKEDFGGMVSIEGIRPSILASDHQSPVPIDVAFRICAIRETFEECGILLLKKARDILSNPDTVTLSSCKATGNADLALWRERVRNDASSFMSLCTEVGGVPDVWSLAEWSNWLTPSDFTTRRFDTIFYITCMDELPEALEDTSEIVQTKWVTPLESLQLFSNAKTYLPPPQVYEFRRLLRFECFDQLYQFSKSRAYDGTERYLPVRCNLEDGVVSLLPGDVYYPEHPKEETDKDCMLELNTTIDDSNKIEITNRLVFRTATVTDILSSYTQPTGQVSPIDDHIPPIEELESNSKL
nr:acyl-coenzyme A diphosphatase NUDT19-like [Lytechinus pictus]